MLGEMNMEGHFYFFIKTFAVICSIDRTKYLHDEDESYEIFIKKDLILRGSVDPNTLVSANSLFFSVLLPTRGAPETKCFSKLKSMERIKPWLQKLK